MLQWKAKRTAGYRHFPTDVFTGRMCVPWVPALGADGSATHMVVSYAHTWAEHTMHVYYTEGKYTGPANAANCICFKNGDRCTNTAVAKEWGQAFVLWALYQLSGFS